MKKTYRFKLCWRYLISAVVLLFCCSLFNNSNAQLLTVDGDPSDWQYVLNNPTSVKAVSFVIDVKQPDGTDNQFTTGAKDYSTAPNMGWSWSQVNDKNELTTAAVAIIEEIGPSGGIEKHMYFFTDRFATNGSAEIGFWVFQNGTAPREPQMDFDPEKTDGDLLVLATFTNGGAVNDIELWQWCCPANLKEARFNLLTSIPGVNACAYVSDEVYPVPSYTDPVYGPWEYDHKFAGSGFYQPGSFFEGCVNLSGLGLDAIKLCGGTFLMETRESHKLSSAVNDFIGGSLNYEFEITAEGDEICYTEGGDNVTLCAKTKEGTDDFLENTTFAWYDEDPSLNAEAVPITGEVNQCLTISIDETTSFWVIGTDPDGCASAPMEAVGIVYDNPTASLSADAECEVDGSAEIDFDASGSSAASSGFPIVSYIWDWDNDPLTTNETTTVDYASHTFAVGTHTVGLTVIDEFGCMGQTTIDVTVYDNPTAAVSADAECEVDGSAEVDFDASGSSAGTNGLPLEFYEWDWDNDPNTANETTTVDYASHTFAVGTHTVGLTVIDEFGCSDHTTIQVTVYDNPTASLSADAECEVDGSAEIDFDASGSSAGTNGLPLEFYVWDWDNDPLTTNETTTVDYASHTFAVGTHTVGLTVIDEFGCSDHTTIEVTVYDNPTAAVSADAECEVDGSAEIDFDVSGSSAGTNGLPIEFYVWDWDNDPNTANETTTVDYASHTFAVGTHTVGLTVIDEFGCSDHTTIQVTVYDNPTADLDADSECEDDGSAEIDFDASGSSAGSNGLPIETYGWDWDNDLIIDATTTSAFNSHSFAVGGPYTVGVTVTDEFGCSDHTTVQFSVWPTPSLIPYPGEECASHESNLTSIEICAEGSVGDTIKWYSDAGATMFLGVSKGLSEGDLISCLTAAVSQTTSYWATVTSVHGCVSEPVEIVATVLPNPICDYTYGANSSNTTGDNGWASVVAYGGTGTLSYLWTTSNGSIGSDPAQATITGLTKGLYIVKITDEKGCWTECEYEILSAPVCEVEGSEVDCFGDTDGTVKVSWVQGTAPFDVYLLDEFDNVLMSATDIGASPYTFLNVPVGKDYFARVVDADGLDTDCGPVDVVQPPDLVCEITNPTNTDCDASNGTAWLDVLDQPDPDDPTPETPSLPLVPGGTPPYTVKYLTKEISGLYPGDLPLQLTDLPEGITVATVIDANLCETTCDITIEENPCDVCETAFGYGGDGISNSFLDDCTPPGPWDNWGWSIHIADPVVGTYEFPMYAGSPVCDPSPGWDSHIVDTALVTYDGTYVTVTLPERVEHYTWTESHIWVGDAVFPETNAPGQWLYKAGDAIEFDGGYIVIHAVYCGPKLPYVSKSAEISTPIALEESALKVYPNPFTDKVTFEFVSGRDAYGVLEIFNITGQKVARILDRPVEEGVMNRVEYSPEHKVSGMYIYRLDLDGELQVGRIIYKE